MIHVNGMADSMYFDFLVIVGLDCKEKKTLKDSSFSVLPPLPLLWWKQFSWDVGWSGRKESRDAHTLCSQHLGVWCWTILWILWILVFLYGHWLDDCQSFFLQFSQKVILQRAGYGLRIAVYSTNDLLPSVLYYVTSWLGWPNVPF